jgi:hypothetical protein
MDVEDGESVAAAEIVGVVAKVVITGPGTVSCGGMAGGDAGCGLGAELGPKAWLRLEEGETG